LLFMEKTEPNENNKKTIMYLILVIK